MDRKLVGTVVAAAGVVLIVVSALAEPIGIGHGDGFGWKQLTGVVLGTGAVVVGVALISGHWRGTQAPQPGS